MSTGLFALAIVSCVPTWANTARAFAPDAPYELRRSSLSIVPDTETQAVTLHVPLRVRTAFEEVHVPMAVKSIGDRLRELPLRPVSIGEAPRLPDDPEPGAGITFFIRF